MPGTQALTDFTDALFDIGDVVAGIAEGGVSTDEVIAALPDCPLKVALVKAHAAAPQLRAEVTDLDLSEIAGAGAHMLSRWEQTLQRHKHPAVGR